MKRSLAMSEELLVDTKGMKCPLPVLKARKALKTLAPGARMRVLATDPGAIDDFKHFCTTTGARLIEQREDAGGVLVFVLEKPV